MNKPTIHTVNYQHFDNLQLSAKDFYLEIKQTIAEYQFPEVTCAVTTLSDNGWFFSTRKYLEIKYHSFTYYVCAAPFGKNFFISWRLQEYNNLWTRFQWWVERKKEKTFYELDTEAIFADSITAIVTALVERIMSEHGFRKRDAVTTP